MNILQLFEEKNDDVYILIRRKAVRERSCDLQITNRPGKRRGKGNTVGSNQHLTK